MATVYKVRCEDNAFRHKVPFDTFSEAANFAKYGHICTATHTVEKWETTNKLVMKETVRG
jgi:hypothetical protein